MARTIEKTLFWIFVIGSLSFALWRCQFSIELYDEAFYVIPGWKSFHLGDRPFRHEILNAPRHHDLLNYYLASRIVPFSLLTIRQASVVFYALCLFGFVGVCFRWKLGLWAGVTFCACLVFNFFQLQSWSYNEWFRNLLLIYCSLILVLLRGRHSHCWGWLVAGVVLGLGVISFLPMFVLFPVSVACLLAMHFRWKRPRRIRRLLIFYCVGFLVPTGADFGYIMQDGIRESILVSFQAVGEQRYGTLFAPLFLLLENARSLFLRKELWWLLLSVFLIEYRYPKPWKKWRTPVLAIFCLLSAAFVLRKLAGLEEYRLTTWMYLCTGFISCLFALWKGYETKSPALFLISFMTGIAAAVFSVSSVNIHWASWWVVPAVVPLWTSSLSRLRSSTLWTRSLGFCVLGYFLVFNYRSFADGVTRSYRDSPPLDLRVRLQTQPLQGIYTNARRANLIESLASVVEDRKHVLALGMLPGIFYFGEVKSSLDTLAPYAPITSGIAFSIYERTIARMVEEQRIPDLIVRSKLHPWLWGATEDLKFEFQTERDPLYLLSECLKGEVLKDFPEFEAFSVKQEKFGDCIQQQTLPKLSNSSKPMRTIG